MDAYFTTETRRGVERLIPLPLAISGWKTEQIKGFAVSGALARSIELLTTQPELRGLHLTRWTVDLLRAARSDAPVVATSSIVRAGRRLCLVKTDLSQGDAVVASGSALFLRPGGETVGHVRSPNLAPLPPPPDLHPLPPESRLFSKDGVWATTPDDQQSADARTVWHVPIPVVAGEPISPIQAAASVADGANLAINWGTADIEFINADLTLQLSRLPDPGGIGLVRISRSEHAGIAVGTSLMFDKDGVFGTSAMSGLANGLAAGHLREYFDPDNAR